MKIANAIAIGAAIITAPTDTSIDPTIKIKAPYVGFEALFGLQCFENKISLNDI
jgi:hypothetical protein